MYHKTGLRYDIPEGQNYDRVPDEIGFSRNLYGGTLRSIQHKSNRDLAHDTYHINKAISSIDFIQLWDISSYYYRTLELFIHQYVFHLGTNRIENLNHTTIHIHRIRPASNLVVDLIYETYLSRYTQVDLVQSIQMIVKNSHVWSLMHLGFLLQIYISRQISTVGGTDGWTVRANHLGSELRPYNLQMPIEKGTMPAFTCSVMYYTSRNLYCGTSWYIRILTTRPARTSLT